MIDKNSFLNVIGDSPQARILDALITGRRLEYSATGIIRAADIGRATFYKVFPKLVKQALIMPTKKIGNMQLYTINQENSTVQALIKLHQHIIMSTLKKYKNKSERLEVAEQLVA